MTHIETQTLDSEPVGFCDNYFSHMETQTTDDLFPDLMDCLASVDADSMDDVIQCHDLHAPHVLRIFSCDDEEPVSSPDFTAGRVDATTITTPTFDDDDGVSMKNVLDQSVQTHRGTSSSSVGAPCSATTTLTRREVDEENDEAEEELMMAVSSLMDSQTQTYFHLMDLC